MECGTISTCYPKVPIPSSLKLLQIRAQNQLQNISKIKIIPQDNKPLVLTNYYILLNPEHYSANTLEKNEETKKTLFTCTYCYQDFTSHITFQKHFKVHTNEHTFPCDVCCKKFKSKKLLKHHIAACKEKINKCSPIKENCLKPEFTCTVCKKSFPTASAHTTHMKYHKLNPMFQCKGCDQTYKTYSKFIKHHDEVSINSEYNCRVCNLSFKLLCACIKHAKISSHTMEQENALLFECDMCPKRFLNKSGVDGHRWVHQQTAKENIKET